MSSRRIVLAATGASGMPYAVRLARFLAATSDIELHLILSEAAKRVLELESDVTAAELAGLAQRTYAQNELDAGPASGSWRHGRTGRGRQDRYAWRTRRVSQSRRDAQARPVRQDPGLA